LICLSPYSAANESTIHALIELQKSKTILLEEIRIKTTQKGTTLEEDEKNRLKLDIKRLNEQIHEIENKFEKIATGVDISSIKLNENKSTTTLSEDFQLLIKPLVESAKEATKEMRQKAQLQEEIAYYKVILPQAVHAHDNIEKLFDITKSEELKIALEPLQKYWYQQIILLSSNLNASLHQIEMLEQNSISFSDSIQENTKNFFQQRGLFLLEGVASFLAVIIIMQLIYFLAIKLFPVLTKANRSFYLRLLDLLYRILTILLAIIIPMGVFYYEEDWILFSVGVLILFGIVWTFRHLVSKLWQQARLLLNVGSVREDERIFYQGLPWRVKNINIFTIIENPTSGVKLRIPIEELVDLTSRPAHEHEPWFPCKLNDWVLLSDNYYGQVIGISLEFIELVDVGGGHRTYLVTDFLALSPKNLSSDFRVVDTLGISYKHQEESTTTIVSLLEQFIVAKIEEEGYSEGLKKLLVQFAHAGESSLNITIIANFKGEMAPLYYRLRRAIGRWCVDACSEYGWEIPFPQLTIHQPKG
ncbi:MAG: hypothetical protein K0U38_08690, partial [Epsilonproteobacteria bacterium]|nr:hypothetical protein [Campylobacterota bacterium]